MHEKNGCASILFEPVGGGLPATALGGWGRAVGEPPAEVAELITSLRDLIIPWCPAGSDPGFCVATSVPQTIVDWGRRCQTELVTQDEARRLAAENDIHLEGLGGTQDGVIGALAAVGLMATKDDGRVVYFGNSDEDWYDVTGCLTVENIRARGVDEVLTADSGQPIVAGTVDIGKRLRPNYRNGKIVLYVTHNEAPHWEAVRVT